VASASDPKVTLLMTHEPLDGMTKTAPMTLKAMKEAQVNSAEEPT
jgi:hypothetical protein